MAVVFFCGDPHGEFKHIIRATLKHRPEAVVLLGDQDCKRPLDIELAAVADKTKVYWIVGNHDTDNPESYDNLFGSALKGCNIQDRIVGVAGITIAGLGGVFREKAIWDGVEKSTTSPKDYLKTCGAGNRWRGGLPLRHRSSIFPSDIAALAGKSVDVLVTHEAPDLHRHGNPALTKLGSDLRVLRAFHGHHHENIRHADGIWTGVAFRAIAALDTATLEVSIIDPGPTSKT